MSFSTRLSIGIAVAMSSANGNEVLSNPNLNYLQQKTYGVDMSFPQQSAVIDPSSPLDSHSRQALYEQFLHGCRTFYDGQTGQGHLCDRTEQDRLEMNRRQPAGMKNYTDMGFRLVQVPSQLKQALQAFWTKNRGKEVDESWFPGNTYTNHWESPTKMLSMDNLDLDGAGETLKSLIWNASQTELENWTDQQLVPTSIYGIRIYTSNSILATHVDRMPFVTSAVINVAQDVDEPWPMELFAHDGKAYNITMEPGDMLLYESHSVLHGRPFPLQGRFYANVFVHFEPIGHSLEHGYDHSLHTSSVQHPHSGFNPSHGLPPYIIDGSLEASRYRLAHDSKAWKPFHYEAHEMEEVTGSNGAHYAAHTGNAEALLHIIQNERKEMIHEADGNGWYPIHEAVRSGNIHIMEILFDHGANVNERTAWGEGHSVLNLAYQFHDPESDVIQYLLSLGAQNIIPWPDEEEL